MRGEEMNIFKSEVGREKVHHVYRELLSNWPVDNLQYKISTSYGETFVIESGSKGNPPLILIHGSVANSFCWIGDVKKYSEHFNVYAIDIIGEAGFSDESRPKYESGAYAEWLREVLDGLSLQSASIVGLSLGAWMALNFGVKYPDRVDHLALLCVGGLHPERKDFIPKAIGLSLLGKWGQNQVTKMLNGGIMPDQNNEGVKKAMEYTMLISKNFNPRMDRLPLYSSNDLKKLTMPILAVYGEKDCMLNVEKSVGYLKASTSAEIVVLEGVGHVITNQTDRIIRFINRK